ncbi:MAG: metallopeptidase TldD-related protein [Elusimicrobiaceae bacterium]|nr:metallopeptidase TldD-related protein [Elusimicrobiaceae bacterium]
MKKLLPVLCACAFLCAGRGYAYTLQTDPALNAMSAELARSTSALTNAEAAPMYYLSYQLNDTRQIHVSAENGGIENSGESFNRYLDVDARVGSRELDNTHEVKGMQGYTFRGNPVSIAAGADIDAIRAELWRWTDFYYKRAQEGYMKVRANRDMTAADDDKSDDFSAPAAPERFYETGELPAVDRTEWETRLKNYTAYLSSFPFVFSNSADFVATVYNRYFVSSEGTRVKTGDVYLRLSYNIATRTEDGMDLRRSKTYAGVRLSDLPDDKRIMADMAESVKELAALKSAPIVEPYSGPAIMRNRAAGVFFHEILGHRLEGHRLKKNSDGQTFAKKINEKIVSEVITVEDDPTLASFDGIALRGHYKYDDEGVKAQKVTLIESGVLKNFLMDRTPAAGFVKSNGHGRRSAGKAVTSRMGNTIVTVKDPVPFDELRKAMIAECRKQGKPYGLVFEDIAGGFTQTGRAGTQSFKVLPLLVYRVYADGRPDEIVRGVDIVGTPLTTFGKIAAGGDDAGVFNGTCGAESGWVPVSAVSPSILVTELEVEKAHNPKEKAPILAPPLTGGEGDVK